MKPTITIVLLILSFIFGCERTKNDIQFVDNFVFSYSAMYSDYSMKFTQSDTVYIQKRFPGTTEHFYFIIKESDRHNVLKLANDIKFAKYDSINDQHLVNQLVDGTGYKFYVEKGTKRDWIYIYGDDGPKEFYEFSAVLNSLKEKQTLQKTNKEIDFGNLDHILLPEPPTSLEIK